jgi:hypothetical protein
MQPNSVIGPCLKRYRARQLRWSDVFTLLIPGICAVLAPLSYAWWQNQYAYTYYGPVAANYWSWPWLLLALLALVIFSVLAIYRLFLARYYVALHANGLRIHLAPLITQTLRWSDLSGIGTSITQDYFLFIPLRTHFQVTIFPLRGKPIRLAGKILNLPTLVADLRIRYYPAIENELVDQLHAGKWLSFGAISIHNQFLRVRNREIAWEQVERLAIKNGHLQIELKGRPMRKSGKRFCNIPASQLINLEILLRLVRYGTTIECPELILASNKW